MNTINEFKKSGYEAQLIYFGWDNLDASVERVKLRVEVGGHDVILETLLLIIMKALKT
jgi:predicted ABC-type ATPase